ncbi:amine dehydrogenase [Rhodococcus triatomae]|uniref:Methylamine dehydrogenase light chain n=1 Tax=Rhodococcus triatomae TaxID=300028 RepID=A0A1G8A6F2_9NOCA|nr:methylamine dehydrogenase light chain [Rhodococcus triatomae]QNG21165.1 amine dehydrogenase [Rhodococcus triatomae]QNG25545.1 amine dehydrogenase [Rhodococcus triatomae]SDH16451.1 methylamine dehydrogenase light chain [Rhodococcus triatomae]
MYENRYPVDENTVREQSEWMAGKGGTFASRATRRMSERVSRRSMISRIGRWTMGVSGVALISSLPVTRSAFAQETPAPEGGGEPQLLDFDGHDPAECEYWRWCNMDGTSCAACNGGGVTTCAPGSKPGAEFWVGCCTDPDDGKTYLIAYYDCCGAPSCSNAFCGEPDTQAIMYNPVSGSYDQEIIWCVSDESQSYTCTMAPIIGEDCQVTPAVRPKVGAGS